jgi:serine/threonine-protein kinase
VLYELVCGRRTFEGDDVEAVLQQILDEIPASVSQVRANVPPALERVINRALSKEVEHRYHDGIAFARDLEHSLQAPGSFEFEPSLRAKIEQLKSLYFFKDFSEGEVKEFLRVGTWMAFRGSETIVYQDEKDSSFYIIVSGDVQVEAQGKTLAQLQRGDCFGELAFLLRSARVASVIARQDCQLLKLSEVMIPLFPQEVQLRVYQSFARVLAEKLVAMDRRYLELS